MRTIPKLPTATRSRAGRYQALKRPLAKEHDDTNVYAEARSAYVRDVVRRAEQTPSCGRSA